MAIKFWSEGVEINFIPGTQALEPEKSKTLYPITEGLFNRLIEQIVMWGKNNDKPVLYKTKKNDWILWPGGEITRHNTTVNRFSVQSPKTKFYAQMKTRILKRGEEFDF
jgi:hypothetical protein